MLMQANLLQPLTDVSTIKLRYDVVEELLGSDELACNIGQCMTSLPNNLDKICSCLALRPSSARKDPVQRIASLVQSTILLREALTALPSLADALQPAKSELLKAASHDQAVRANTVHPAFAKLLQTVDEVLDRDAASSRTPFVNRTQQCFAVKGGVDSFLDLARSSFCRISEDIHELAAKYRDSHSMDSLKLQYAAKRGFYLLAPRPGAKMKGGVAGPLPRKFVQLEGGARSRDTVACTTAELNALNARLKDATNDCMIITEQILEGTASSACQYLSMLHRLIDGLALLDMLASFALAIRQADSTYVRPQLTEHGPMAIMEGRHPLVEQIIELDYQANDTYLAETSSFYVITGPNMAGKTTYLRQVALITILAHMGCYVPAKKASLRAVDRLLTRIGTSDSIENNSSSFMMEMQETAHILSHATERSLVLIDELGRATSTADGVAIAWAVSEHLIGAGAFTLFATHFAPLGELAHMHPNCKQWHFGVDPTAQGLEHQYGHKLVPGEGAAVHYGLLMAPAVGLPDTVTEEARRIANAVEAADASLHTRAVEGHASEMHDVFSLAHRIVCVAQAHQQNPLKMDIRKQLALLKQEARSLTRH
ncbi:g9020 [Coccomyxa elongata]